MARLPIPGGDNGDWGDILNAFLDVSHNQDGTLANNTVGTNQLRSGSVTSVQLDSSTQSAIASIADLYAKPAGGIPSSDLASSVQTSLTSADSAVQSVNGKSGSNITLDASDVDALSSSQLGAANGAAQLNGSGTLETAQLPSSVVSAASSGGAIPWAANTQHKANTIISNAGTLYIVDTTYMSGSTFGATDLANITSMGGGANVVQDPLYSTDGATNFQYHGRIGYDVPKDWGNRAWRPALAQAIAGTGLATVGIAPADSLSYYDSSNPMTTAWTGLCKTALQTLGGNAGFGYWPSSMSDYAVNAFAGSGVVTTWEAVSALWATTGTWTKAANGIGNNSLETTVNGSTVQSPSFYGRYIDIYMIEGNVAATWTYSIDGVASGVTITPGSSNVEVKHTIDCLTIGNHVINITFTGASGTLFFGGGRWRTGGNGVLVDTYGRYGSTSANWIEGYGLGWNGGSKQPCDLLIAAIGVNDSNAQSFSYADTWEQNLRVFLNDALGGTGQTGATDVLMLMHHIGNNDTGENSYQAFTERARGLAEAYGAALVDMWSLGRNNWNYWNALNYWGNATTSNGAAGTDSVHLSNAGHQAVWNAVGPLVVATS